MPIPSPSPGFRTLLAAAILLGAVAFLRTGTYAQVTASDLTWNFECGSLGSAQTVAPNELNLTLRLDDSGGDLYGWYDFKIVRHAAGQTVTFHILNRDTWMSAGHKPVYSQDGGQTWYRITDVWMGSDDLHFRQTFTADSTEIALAFPYGYSRLMSHLDSLDTGPWCQVDTVGQSVHLRDIPLVTITDPAIPEMEKITVWLMARQHSMETPASFILQELMEFLTDQTDPLADRMRRTTIYKILPMVNVDGVAEGYSRHNVMGFNLNRCWAYDSLHIGEQPEVYACHRAMDEWIYAGHPWGLFNDFHCAPDLYDFGFKLSASYTSPAYNQDVTSFVKYLDYYDPFQDWTLWRDMESSYGSGLVCMALYQQHGLEGTSSENSWSRRGNGQYITIPTLLAEGPMYARAFDDYVHAVRWVDSAGEILETLRPGQALSLQVKDYDRNLGSGWVDSIQVRAGAESSGDVEWYVLRETGPATGVFQGAAPVSFQSGSTQPGNGCLEIGLADRLAAAYVDDDYPQDSCWAYLSCQASAVMPLPEPSRPQDLALGLSPNPFNPSTEFTFTLPRDTWMRLSLWNTAGQRVALLAEGVRAAGLYQVEYDGSHLASGTYFYRLRTEYGVITGKLVRLK